MNDTDAGSGSSLAACWRSTSRCSRICARLDLKVVACFGRIELVMQGTLDLARCRVMSLDQVRIVAVHHPDQFGQACGRTRMQARAKAVSRARQRRHEIDDLRAAGIQQARLNPSRGLFAWCQMPILAGWKQLKSYMKLQNRPAICRSLPPICSSAYLLNDFNTLGIEVVIGAKPRAIGLTPAGRDSG